MQSTYIFDQRVDSLTQHQIMRKIVRAVAKNKRLILFAMNTHILTELRAEPSFQKQHTAVADVIFSDGMPIVWLSRFWSHPIPERINGTELVARVLQQPKMRVYIVGSTTPILRKIKALYPSICGYFAPPFGKKWTSEIDSKILADINKMKPDIVMIGVSPLKQEKWIITHRSNISAPVLMAVGSAFDILSGATPRAPMWMQKSSLEWVWRMMLEPGRLTPRYLFIIKEMLYLLVSLLVVFLFRRSQKKLMS